MAAFRRKIALVPEFGPITSAPGFTSTLLDGLADSLVWVFQADHAATITEVGFRQNSITGTPGVARVSLQGVNAAGAADGTILASGGGFVDYTPVSGNNAVFLWLTLGTPVSVVAGQLLALCIIPLSGTWDASNWLSVHSRMTGWGAPQGRPYAIENGTRGGSNMSLFGVASASRVMGNPLQVSTTLNVNTGTNPDEVAVAFSLASGWGQQYRVRGVEFGFSPVAGQSGDLILYAADGVTPLQTLAVDCDQVLTAGVRSHTFYFADTLADLSFGTTYYLAWRPGSATSQAIPYIEVNRVMDLGAWNNSGEIVANWVSRANAAPTWTANTRRMPLMQLLIEEWTPAAGGLKQLWRSPLAGGKVA